ncbi:MAG: urease accessory protein UreE [Methylohalobius sp. ZOD2]
MLKVSGFATPGAVPGDTITLSYQMRQKSRLLVRTEGGFEAGIFLPRGTVLRDGDLLAAEDGRTIRIRAALEPVSVARSGDPWLFARACYHLGNRHVALQIGAGELRYLADHVLDDMVRGLGVPVELMRLNFEPEGGAYPTHPHAH